MSRLELGARDTNRRPDAKTADARQKNAGSMRCADAPSVGCRYNEAAKRRCWCLEYSTEKAVIGGETFDRASFGTLHFGQVELRHHCSDDAGRYLVLQIEDVLK